MGRMFAVEEDVSLPGLDEGGLTSAATVVGAVVRTSGSGRVEEDVIFPCQAH